MKSGQGSNSGDSPIPTTSSFHMTTNRRVPQTHNRAKKDPVCVFCKWTHKINSCNTVTCPKKCLTIVKSDGLCFNCLAHHEVSQCNSRFNYKEYKKKHHTSLCYAFATNSVSPQQDPPNETLTTMISTSLSASYTSFCLLKLP